MSEQHKFLLTISPGGGAGPCTIEVHADNQIDLLNKVIHIVRNHFHTGAAVADLKPIDGPEPDPVPEPLPDEPVPEPLPDGPVGGTDSE